MNFILLTQYDGKIVGPFAKLLGILMNGIYDAISSMGIPNIGLAIILFTIIVNILLIPLTVMQQKNMKLNAVVNPELQKIQSKYKGKRDQASMEKQQKETQMIYDKYGYNPTSGCLPTLVQFPIMLALYRVIYQIPGYVTGIKDQLQEIATIALKQNDFASKIADLANANAMNPEKYASSLSFQTLQGMYAIGSGGFFGKGLGNSAQKMIIPEVQNDFILTVICEELGVFGAIMVFVLFGLLLYRLLFIAQNAPDLYGALIVTGIFSHIAIQVILNVAVVVNLIPNTGITLPFISYGGTSVLFLMIEMGIALGVSRKIKIEE